MSCVWLVAILAAVFVVVPVSPVGSAPPTPDFGPEIDDYAPIQVQETCDPTPKPGVVAFRDLVHAEYPWTRKGYISRECHIGGRSEHKEGRAWDWGVNVFTPSERAAADDLLNWLTATDRHGNAHALARRFGIMYMIWNRQIWKSYGSTRGTWRPYSGKSPHTDHVHFSFSWDGAYKRTSFWSGSAPVTYDPYYRGMAGTREGNGYWLVGRDGGVFSYGDAAFHGSLGGQTINAPIVGMERTPSGNGYWLVAADGGVFTFGDAPFLGSMGGQQLNAPVVGMERTRSGNGYWLVAADGGVFSFGNAQFMGSMAGQQLNAPIVGIARSASGNDGYRLAAADGGVFDFGAQHKGSMAGHQLNAPVVGIERSRSGRGFWLVAGDGGVFSFGDAPFHGSMSGIRLNEPVVGMSRTPSGEGYWLVAGDGGIFTFGDAPFKGSRVGD